jgi:hypothetical protein
MVMMVVCLFVRVGTRRLTPMSICPLVRSFVRLFYSWVSFIFVHCDELALISWLPSLPNLIFSYSLFYSTASLQLNAHSYKTLFVCLFRYRTLSSVSLWCIVPLLLLV